MEAFASVRFSKQFISLLIFASFIPTIGTNYLPHQVRYGNAMAVMWKVQNISLQHCHQAR